MGLPHPAWAESCGAVPCSTLFHALPLSRDSDSTEWRGMGWCVLWGLTGTTGEWIQIVNYARETYQPIHNWHIHTNIGQKVSKFEKAVSMVPLSKEKCEQWEALFTEVGQSCDNDFGTGPFFCLWHLSWSNIQDLDWRLLLWNTMNVISRKQGRTDVAGLKNSAWHSLSLWKE